MSKFILVDRLQERKGSAYKYFEEMAGIGPKHTNSIQDAKSFSSAQDAMMSPAYTHSMCFFEPVEAQTGIAEE